MEWTTASALDCCLLQLPCRLCPSGLVALQLVTLPRCCRLLFQAYGRCQRHRLSDACGSPRAAHADSRLHVCCAFGQG
eukprot:585704-Alexandrium_andersonii.AAC.1